MRTSFLVQQRDGRCRWRTVTAAATRPTANMLAHELRRALIASSYSPAAEVRVVSDVELAHEMRIARAADVVSGSSESPVDASRMATLLPVDLAD